MVKHNATTMFAAAATARMDPCGGPSRCDRSLLGPRAGRCFFFPRVQMAGRTFFCVHHTKKRPYHLNMMRVTVIDKPSSEERVMVTHEGKEACC